MLLSLIVPVYNMELYLEECIKSIAGQNVDSMEVILINDGSTDCSGEICDKWALQDKRIKVVHKENGGLSSGRNLGLKIACGKYISFVDPDDFVLSDTYDKLLKKLETENADAIFFGWKEIREQKIVEVQIGCKEKLGNAMDAIQWVLFPWSGYRGYVWNKIYKTEIVKNIEFDTKYSHAEDLLWNVQVLQKMNRVLFTDMAVNMHRIRPNSLSHFKLCERRQLQVFEVREKVIELLDDKHLESIEKFAYHWDLTLMLKREMKNDNVQGINLLMECYKREYQKEFYKNVSCKAGIENYFFMHKVNRILHKG